MNKLRREHYSSTIMDRRFTDEYTNEPVAVIWYDGRQECKIVNVASHENTDRTDENYDSSRISNTTGINNVAFLSSDGDENTDFSRSSSDSSNIVVTTRRGRSSRIASLDDVSSCSTPYEPSRASASSSIRNVHINPSFEMPNELSSNKVVIGRSPIHPDVFLVRNNASELSSCSCSISSSGTASTSSPGNNDELVLQIHSTELDEDLSNKITINSPTNTLEKRLHFLKRGTPISPECSVHISDITDDVPASHCPNCTNINEWKRTDGEECCEPPPHYSSLRFMFIEDEPPKYQDVTGKKLNMGDPPKMVSGTS